MHNEKRDIRLTFIIFSGIITYVGIKSYPAPDSYLYFCLSLALLLLLTFIPTALRPLFLLWLKAAHILGKINTQILLFIIYICIFTPMSTLFRIIGKDPLKRSLDKKKTYWEKYELACAKDKSRYERQF